MDAAVLDAPELEMESPSLDMGGDSDPVEQSTDEAVPGQEPDVDPELVTPADPAEPVFTAPGKLSAAAKATLEEIKGKNPQLFKAMKEALYGREAMQKAFPGGIKEAQQIKATLEQIGGEEGFKAVQANARRLDDLDTAYIKADPRFIEELTANPEGQTAFLKLAPSIFSKYAEMSPEGFGSYVSNVFVNDMRQEGVPLMLQRLQDFIGDNPKAMETLNGLIGYVNRIGATASKQIKIPDAVKPQIDERGKALDEREAGLTRNEWRGETNTERMKVFGAEFAKLTAGRKLTDVQIAGIKELYASRMQKALANPQFNDTAERFFAAKDKPGFLRHSSAAFRAEIPKALKAAFDTILPGRPGPKPGTPAPSGKVAVIPTRPDQGWQWAAAAPKSAEIDFRTTTSQMVREGKAILIGGKRVQWRKS